MKRMICLMLCVGMVLLSAVSAAAEADTAMPDEEEGERYFEKFVEAYPEWNTGGSPWKQYHEVYYHYADGGEEPDWALATAYVDIMPGEEYDLFYDRIVYYATTDPFGMPYVLYDVAADEWQPLKLALTERPALRDVCNELEIGMLLGDIDGDYVISINDATMIQRCLAQLEEFDDDLQHTDYGATIISSHTDIRYLSDFNRDGDRSITDATYIQRYLAHLSTVEGIGEYM